MRRRLSPFLGLFVVAMAAVAAGPVSGAQPADRQTQVVRVPFPQDEGSLTPYSFETGYPLVTLVYDTLLWRDEGGVPRPWLAESVEESDDGRQLRITLVAEARWHDGRPVTAADVAFTLRRLMAERPHPRFTPQLQAITAVETLDDRRLVVRLRHPSPGFRDQPLADMPILPAHLWEGLRPAELTPPGLAVGSGPYRLVDHRPGEGYRLEANPSYFRGTPTVGRLEVPIVDSLDEMLRRLQRGAVDAVPVSLPSSVARSARSVSVRLQTGRSFLGTALFFNVNRPPFDDVIVRRAVAAALDLRRIARAAGGGLPANNGFVHPGSRWAASRDLHRFDLRVARSVAASLPPVRVLAPDNDAVKQEAGRQVALALQRAGITSSVELVSPEGLAEALGDGGGDRSFEAAIGVIPALVSHDPDFLARIFGSNPATAPLNRTGYSSERFDELAVSVASSPVPEQRQQAIDEMLQLLASEAPAVPLLFESGRYAVRPGAYDGWVVGAATGILDKRSFLPGSRPRPAAEVGGQEQPRRTTRSIPLLGLGAVLAASAAVVLAVVGLVSRLRRH